MMKDILGNKINKNRFIVNTKDKILAYVVDNNKVNLIYLGSNRVDFWIPFNFNYADKDFLNFVCIRQDQIDEDQFECLKYGIKIPKLKNPEKINSENKRKLEEKYNRIKLSDLINKIYNYVKSLTTNYCLVKDLLKFDNETRIRNAVYYLEQKDELLKTKRIQYKTDTWIDILNNYLDRTVVFLPEKEEFVNSEIQKIHNL